MTFFDEVQIFFYERSNSFFEQELPHNSDFNFFNSVRAKGSKWEDLFEKPNGRDLEKPSHAVKIFHTGIKLPKVLFQRDLIRVPQMNQGRKLLFNAKRASKLKPQVTLKAAKVLSLHFNLKSNEMNQTAGQLANSQITKLFSAVSPKQATRCRGSY